MDGCTVIILPFHGIKKLKVEYIMCLCAPCFTILFHPTSNFFPGMRDHFTFCIIYRYHAHIIYRYHAHIK